MLRVAIGFLLFPLPAALARALVVWRWPSPVGGVFAHPASMFVAMCLFVYILELVLGAPILLVLRRNGREGLLEYAAAGFAVLTIPSIFSVVALAIAHRFVWANGLAILVAAVCGLLGGAFFWGVARPRPRPRDYGSAFD